MTRLKNLMAKQNKRSLCACGCDERKTSRKMKFLPGHNQSRKDTRKDRDMEKKLQ
jgi:hypothetical protein